MRALLRSSCTLTGARISDWLGHCSRAASASALQKYSHSSHQQQPQQPQPQPRQATVEERQGSLHDPQLLAQYRSLVAGGTLQADPVQDACLSRLAVLCGQLDTYSHSVQDFNTDSRLYQSRRDQRRHELRLEEAEEARQRQQEQQGWTAWWKQKGPTTSDESDTQQAISAARVREQKLDRELGSPPKPPTAPQGLYIYGSVGSGKSLIMQMFYNRVAEGGLVPLRRRMHFNAAMLEVHARLHKLEQERQGMDEAAMAAYATQIAMRQLHKPAEQDDAASAAHSAEMQMTYQDPQLKKQKAIQSARLAVRRMLRMRTGRSPEEQAAIFAQANAVVFRQAAAALIRGQDDDTASGWDHSSVRAAGVLCFDEVQVTDPFAALALKGIIEALLEEGIIIVATSNRAPWELNRQGIHEDLFQHFVSKLLQATAPFELSSAQDYRRVLPLQQARPQYLHPLSAASSQAMGEHWREVTANAIPQQQDVAVMFGRILQVQQAAGGAASFRFEELCARPLGSADYLALARAFHTIFLHGIPAMSLQVKDQARRFITLVDELYNNRVRLICTAACPPDVLFTGAESHEEAILDLEGLQFETAVEGSRLRRDLTSEGGVAPLGGTTAEAINLSVQLGGLEEKFAFKRAISRLHEMQSAAYLLSRSRHE